MILTIKQILQSVTKQNNLHTMHDNILSVLINEKMNSYIPDNNQIDTQEQTTTSIVNIFQVCYAK